MSNVTDVLVISKANGSYAAKLSFESGEATWINDGEISSRGRIVIAQHGHSVKVELARDQVSQFKADVANGEDSPHHRIVGRATVDDAQFIAFFDKSGTRVSLKPARDSAENAETVSIADQFA